MKKLFLLMAAGLMVTGANAQENSSVMLAQNYHKQMPTRTKVLSGMPTATVHNNANKTTGTGTVGSWWSFQVAANNGSIDGGFIPNYPDSTLLVPEGTPPFYWWCHGLGTSFDPTSNYFGNGFLNTNATPPPFTINNSNAYTVDSIEVAGYYNRYNTSTAFPPDTLYVDIAAAPETGTYLANFTPSDFVGSINFTTLGISNDTIVYVAAPYYDYAANAITATHTPSVIHIVKILDSAAYADSTPNGLHDWIFPISVSVPAGGKLVAYTHFGSGHQYSLALGSTIDTANYWYSLSYDLALSPLQNSGSGVAPDYNMGLVGSTDARYGLNDWTVSGNPIPDPSYFYSSPTTVHDPYYNFYITCASCSDVAVPNVTKSIAANAYPNPAVSEVNIPFTSTKAANVTVSLSNTLGQVVKTQTFNQTTDGKAVFNAAELSDGVYFYTVKADGQQVNGRIVVAH